jgi:hypothetical protein
VGQGTADVKGMAGPGRNGAGADSPREVARRLDRDIDAVRDELSGLVSELKRRGRDALDVKLQLKRHGPEIALAAAGVVAAAVATAWLGAHRTRRRDRLPARAGRLRQAVSRMIDRPERVAVDPRPSVIAQIATAAATSVVVAITKRAVNRFLARPPLSPRLLGQERASVALPVSRTADEGGRPGRPDS